GDIIASVDGRAVGTWTELRRELAGAPRRMTITYLRPVSIPSLGAVLYEPRQTSLVSEQTAAGGARRIEHGLHPADRFVRRVEPGSPAARAGIRPGDLLTTNDGEPIAHWLVLERRLRAHPDKTFQIGWRRPGEAGEMTAAIRQQWRPGVDELGHRRDVLVFGVEPSFERGRGEMIEIDGRFTYAISRAVDRTVETIAVMASGLGSILRGKSPADELGGPIMMFQAAAVSGRQGWEALFFMIALVSVSVGLINLLPIPVLDGGHLLVFAVEAVR